MGKTLLFVGFLIILFLLLAIFFYFAYYKIPMEILGI